MPASPVAIVNFNCAALPRPPSPSRQQEGDESERLLGAGPLVLPRLTSSCCCAAVVKACSSGGRPGARSSLLRRRSCAGPRRRGWRPAGPVALALARPCSRQWPARLQVRATGDCFARAEEARRRLASALGTRGRRGLAPRPRRVCAAEALPLPPRRRRRACGADAGRPTTTLEQTTDRGCARKRACARPSLQQCGRRLERDCPALTQLLPPSLRSQARCRWTARPAQGPPPAATAGAGRRKPPPFAFLRRVSTVTAFALAGGRRRSAARGPARAAASSSATFAP